MTVTVVVVVVVVAAVAVKGIIVIIRTNDSSSKRQPPKKDHSTLAAQGILKSMHGKGTLLSETCLLNKKILAAQPAKKYAMNIELFWLGVTKILLLETCFLDWKVTSFSGS